MYKILYGILLNSIDVTSICYTQLNVGGIIIIPSCDPARASIFGDPIFGTVKTIFIQNVCGQTSEYSSTVQISIDTNTGLITCVDVFAVHARLNALHSEMKMNHGVLTDEYPEQLMVARFLTGNEKVLEIGANVGRNSLCIAKILGDNDRNLVCLESDQHTAFLLMDNRDINNMHFQIEGSALSERRLLQNGWATIASNEHVDGWTQVNTISLNELRQKYQINFDTLVLDCEGAFYYILTDMPSILDNITLIIMENDYFENPQWKMEVDAKLLANNFYAIYVESGGPHGPLYNVFYEVWRKRGPI